MGLQVTLIRGPEPTSHLSHSLEEEKNRKLKSKEPTQYAEEVARGCGRTRCPCGLNLGSSPPLWSSDGL